LHWWTACAFKPFSFGHVRFPGRMVEECLWRQESRLLLAIYRNPGMNFLIGCGHRAASVRATLDFELLTPLIIDHALDALG
jgi:hypothetical protein